jgi:hypothetical protein
MEEDVELSVKELHMWCHSVQDRILLVQIACKYKCTYLIDQIVKEAISRVQNHYDCTYILKANVHSQFLTLQQKEDLFTKASEWAEYPWEYLEFIELGPQCPSMIFAFEDALEKASELANTCFDCCCMGEFYTKLEKDSDIACLWYHKAVNLVEDDEDREAVFKLIERDLNDEDLKGEIYEEFFDQAQRISLRLELFYLLKSKFWDEQKSKEKWADFCYEIILNGTWQDLYSICDQFYQNGRHLLRHFIDKNQFDAPTEVVDLLAYAHFLKMLYSDENRTREWIKKACDLEIDKDSLEHEVFLTIASAAWKELNDSSFTHEIIEEAAKRIENVDEYYQIIDTLNETTKDKSLMKEYCNSCIAKKYPTLEYHRIASFAAVILQDDDIANRALEQALKNVSDYDGAQLIRSISKYHELDRRYFNKSLVFMQQFVTSSEDAVDLAQVLHLSEDTVGVEKGLEKALNLAKSAEDYSFVIRFVNFWLRNTSKAQFILKLAIKEAAKESDFELLVKDAKLIYGLEWKKAF